MSLTTLVNQGCFDATLEKQINDNFTSVNGQVNGGTISPAKISATGAVTFAQAPNYIASETGANNALVAALLDASGVAVPVAAGLMIILKLGHTIQAGANTLNLNAAGAASIKKASNPATDVAVTGAVGTFLTMVYDGTVWQVVGQ